MEVWNASDKTQAARMVMALLRKKGLDVVKIGDFSTRQYQTLVVDRSGNLRPAQAVADAQHLCLRVRAAGEADRCDGG